MKKTTFNPKVIYQPIYIGERRCIINTQTGQIINEHFIKNKKQAIKEAREHNLIYNGNERGKK